MIDIKTNSNQEQQAAFNQSSEFHFIWEDKRPFGSD